MLAVRWAAAEVSDPPADPIDAVEPVSYLIESGQVGRTLDFNGFAQWSTEVELAGFAPGIVTEVMVSDGATIDAGDVVLSVDLKRTVVAVGSVPAFRALASGVEGPDVAQLQRFLAEGGWYDGALDGEFGSETRGAVKTWQRAAGMADDGIVDIGELAFLKNLPATIRVPVVVGERIAGSETPVLEVLSTEPKFWIPVAPQQQQLIPPDATIQLHLPSGPVAASIAQAIETESGLELYLDGVGGPICESGCEGLSVVDRNPIDVTVEIVPETTGPVVPLSAINLQPSGTATVLLESGEEHPIEIIAEDRGLVVIDGVTVGTRILLNPGDT